MTVVKVSLSKLFSQEGLNLVECCPKCKKTNIIFRVTKQYWDCQTKGCTWKGKNPALKINGHYDIFIDKIIEQAEQQKDLIVLALDQGCILPIELTGVL